MEALEAEEKACREGLTSVGTETKQLESSNTSLAAQPDDDALKVSALGPTTGIAYNTLLLQCKCLTEQLLE